MYGATIACHHLDAGLVHCYRADCNADADAVAYSYRVPTDSSKPLLHSHRQKPSESLVSVAKGYCLDCLLCQTQQPFFQKYHRETLAARCRSRNGDKTVHDKMPHLRVS